MPLYEYECTSCHRRTEKIQKFSDPELTVCPHCGEALERTITAAAIAFKGGGWFKDGYGSVKPAAAAGEGSGAAGGGGSAADTSSATPSAGDAAKSSDGAKSGDSAKPAATAASAAPAAAPAAAAKA